METKPTFIPELSIGHGITDITFYKNAFGAIELWRINNPDGSIHVAAFAINGAEFRLHEEREGKADYDAVKIGLSVDDVYAVVAKAIAAGAIELSPVTDYEYGYRQADIKDPFGHSWAIEKLLSKEALDSFVNNNG